MKNISIYCWKCGQSYKIKNSERKALFDLRVDFAVCSYCGAPNNPKLWEEHKANWRCSECGVPSPPGQRFSKEYCPACYFEKYRLRKKQKVYN